MFTKTKKAFTIVELVIVIAVIAILMGIMFVGGTAISNNAKASTLDSDFRTFETNIKAMVNDPDAHCIQTKAAGMDPTTGAVKDLMDKYFEGDLELNATTDAFAKVTTHGSNAARTYAEGAFEMLDPYGMPYKLVVLDDSSAEVTDITFIVYSYGKNKQTATAPVGSFDADDVGVFIQIVDSVVYTGEIDGDADSNKTPITNGTAADDGKAYKDAVDAVPTAGSYVAAP